MGKTYEVSKNDSELPELEFISYRAQMKEEGSFTFTFDRVSHNDEAGSSGEGEVVTLVNVAESQAVSDWVSPYPDAQFEVKHTDGDRLLKAIIRAFKKHLPEGEIDADGIVAVANNEGGGTLTVEKVTMDNGPDAGRWTVKA